MMWFWHYLFFLQYKQYIIATGIPVEDAIC